SARRRIRPHRPRRVARGGNPGGPRSAHQARQVHLRPLSTLRNEKWAVPTHAGPALAGVRRRVSGLHAVQLVQQAHGKELTRSTAITHSSSDAPGRVPVCVETPSAVFRRGCSLATHASPRSLLVLGRTLPAFGPRQLKSLPNA